MKQLLLTTKQRAMLETLALRTLNEKVGRCCLKNPAFWKFSGSNRMLGKDLFVPSISGTSWDSGTRSSNGKWLSRVQTIFMEYPVTQAIRELRAKKVKFTPHLYDYVEKGGTFESAKQLGVDEYAVIKTLVFETNEIKPLIVLMHGDQEVSQKNLARFLNVKTVEPASAERAMKWTGYQFGGTSPFGLKTQMPVYVEKTIFDLERIYINGGKRGFLVKIEPKVLNEVLEAIEVEVGI
jgi:Cys-tRNA(Pro) deacylase